MKKEGVLSEEDVERLHILESQKDKKVRSAFEAYVVLRDWEDLVNSFNMICGHKRQVISSAPQVLKKFNAVVSTEVPAPNATAAGGMFNLMRMP